jgi:hypothetical protein
VDLRGLNKNGRAVHWALENAPMRDGWACAGPDGWLMEDPPGLDRTAAGLRLTLRSLARRGAVQLMTGADGQLYARHVNRACETENTQVLTAPGTWLSYPDEDPDARQRDLAVPGFWAFIAPRQPTPAVPGTYSYTIIRARTGLPVHVGTARNEGHAMALVRGYERYWLDHPATGLLP